MSKLRVTLVHYSAPPEVGGVETVLAQHARLLLDAGYPVTLVTGRGGTDSSFARARVVVIPELDSQYPSNLEIGEALARTIIPPEFYTLQARIEVSLKRIWQDSDVVIVHNMLTTHHNLPATAALYRMTGQSPVRVIAWGHDVSRFVRASSEFPPRFGFPWDLLRTYRADITYVAVSRARQLMLAQTLGIPRERIHVIPNGVDPVALLRLGELGQRLVNAFGLLEADVIALMPVRVTRAKNVEYALHVMAALVGLGLHARLVVTGPADPHDPDGQNYFRELLQLRRELQLEDKVHFGYEGTVPGVPRLLSAEVVAELYRVSDLVLMPSRREGFGIPVFEGGLSGKPVFVTAMPAVSETGAELVHLIRPDESPEQLAARIKAWADEDVTQRLRQKVRQQYTWSALFSRAIEPLLAECVQLDEARS